MSGKTAWKHMPEVVAIAETWASIDGKLTEFKRCQTDQEAEAELGYYEGYISEAEEAVKRLAHRGFVIVPMMEGVSFK